jgi:hypothetical protein
MAMGTTVFALAGNRAFIAGIDEWPNCKYSIDAGPDTPTSMTAIFGGIGSSGCSGFGYIEKPSGNDAQPVSNRRAVPIEQSNFIVIS